MQLTISGAKYGARMAQKRETSLLHYNRLIYRLDTVLSQIKLTSHITDPSDHDASSRNLSFNLYNAIIRSHARALIGTQMLRLGLNEVRQNSSGGGRMDGRKGSLDLEKVRPITILREQWIPDPTRRFFNSVLQSKYLIMWQSGIISVGAAVLTYKQNRKEDG